MTDDKVTMCALLEIVKRINQAIEAWKQDENVGDGHDWNVVPKHAVLYPSVKCGDVFYVCEDLNCSVLPVTIVRADRGYCAYVYHEADVDKKGRMHVHWAGSKELFPSAAEAVRSAAEKEVAYCTKWLEKARRVFAALDAGKDAEEALEAGGIE